MPPSEPGTSRSFRKIPVWSLLLIALLLGIALFGEKGILRTLKLSREKAVLQEQIKELEATKAALRKEIEALRSDRRYIESIARRELGMVKDDEVVYQFPSEGKKKEADTKDAEKK